MDRDFASMTSAVLESYGYSENDLAKVLGTSQPTVHRIKTGEVKNPGFSTGAQIVELFEKRPNAAA